MLQTASVDKALKVASFLLSYLEENGGAMLLCELKDKSGFPRRAIYRSLKKLCEEKLLWERIPLWDTRQTVVFLNNDEARAKAKILIARRPLGA